MNGNHIKKVFISKDKKILIFETEWGTHFGYRAVADCCNDVYFNHCDGIETVIDATVKEVDIFDDRWCQMYEKNGKQLNSDNCIEALRVKTDKGYCFFELRSDFEAWAYHGNIEEEGDFNIEDMQPLLSDY